MLIFSKRKPIFDGSFVIVWWTEKLCHFGFDVSEKFLKNLHVEKQKKTKLVQNKKQKSMDFTDTKEHVLNYWDFS